MSSTTVRKSAFGRTSLFLANDDRTLVRTIRMPSAAMRRTHGGMYHNLARSAERVPRICCWHCCEEIDGEEFVVPKSYDPTEGVFYVYGHFDCLECARAYIVEHTSFDSGHQMSVFGKMVRDVYGIDNVQQAPPRVALKRFGGPFDVASFRREPFHSRLLEPPFVAYCMLAEERPTEHSLADTLGTTTTAVDEDEFGEPPPSSMYDAFLTDMKEDEGSIAPTSASEVAPSRPKRPRTASASAAGADASVTTEGMTTREKKKAQSGTLRKFFKQ